MIFDDERESSGIGTLTQEDANSPSPQEITNQLTQLASAYRLPADMVQAVAQTVSGLDTDKVQATSPSAGDDESRLGDGSNRYGVMQISDQQIGKTVRDPYGTPFSISDDVKDDWRANAEAGVALLAQHYGLAQMEQPFASDQEQAQQAFAGYSAGNSQRDRYSFQLPYSDAPAHPDDRAFLRNFIGADGLPDLPETNQSPTDTLPLPKGTNNKDFKVQPLPLAPLDAYWKPMLLSDTASQQPSPDSSSNQAGSEFTPGWLQSSLASVFSSWNVTNTSSSQEDAATPSDTTAGTQQNQNKTGTDTKSNIVSSAQKYSDAGSTDWAFNAKKDEFPANSNKCNKFVGDVTAESGAPATVIGKDGKPLTIAPGSDVPRPPTAAEWADPNVTVPNWRPLQKGEAPQPGDVAAYKLPMGGGSYTGHSGIVTSVEPNGTVHAVAAHADVVGPDDKFQPDSTEHNVIYRRYVGP